MAAAAVGDEGEVPEEDKALIHVPAMAPCPTAFRGQPGLRTAELRTLGVDVEGGVPSGDVPARAGGGWLQGHAQLARQRSLSLVGGSSFSQRRDTGREHARLGGPGEPGQAVLRARAADSSLLPNLLCLPLFS